MDHLPTWRAVRNPLWTAAALVIVVQGLAEAQQVLLPIVTAIMLAIIVAPAVRWLEQHRVPRVAAVLAVVLGMMAVLAGVGALIGGSVASFTQKVDFYKAELADKGYRFYMWLQAKGVNVTAEQLKTMVDPGAAAGHAMQYVGKTWNAATTVLSNTILVMLTMVLILLEGATVPAKLRALSGAPDADLSHFNRIAVDVQRYLGIKTALSLGTGVLIWLWCTILGVDFALLWGLLAFLLNYIPNIGSIIAAVPAVLLALVQHGPGTALALAAGYVFANMVLGNVVEPMWMGRKLGLSTVVVLLSLVVWYEIWGTMGALLSVPLTMVIKIMLENSRDYGFVATLLDSGGAAEPAVVESAPSTKRARHSGTSEDD